MNSGVRKMKKRGDKLNTLLVMRSVPARRMLFQRVMARDLLFLFFFLGACHGLAGCGDQVRRPSAEEIAAFEAAGQGGPSIDMDRMGRARIPVGPYRVVPGDVLQLEMPRILDPQLSNTTAAGADRETYRCRISDDGAIVLPVIGQFLVAGKSLAEIESSVMAEYYPKYINARFPVYVSALEYKTHRVSITGAVARVGVYNLRHDQMSLTALLMEAGGIVDAGAAVIRITRQYGPEVRPVDESDFVVPPAGVRRASYPWTHPTVSRLDFIGNDNTLLGDRSAIQMVFKPEGPLATTGWLMVEKRGTMVCGAWLDLESDAQRRALLERADRRLTPSETVGLEGNLLRLADSLGSSGERHGTGRTLRGSGWEKTSAGCFLTALQRTSARESVVAGGNRDGTVVLPVKGLNVPAVDVALTSGDSVIVERPQTQYIVVLGLVARPDSFPYPPNAQFNLAQALGLAGGLDAVADPRYVSIYRLTAEGTVVSATLQIVSPKKGEHLTDALALPLKPGDVVYVEHTPRTRTNVFLDRVFRISLGLFVTPDDFLDR